MTVSLEGARELCIAAAVLAATSLAVRQRLAESDDTGLADNFFANTASLAERLAVSPAALAEIIDTDAGFLPLLKILSEARFFPRLHLRAPPAVNARAEALWQEVLGALAEVGADARPLAVWVAPLWVTDIVSPYAREVRPLLKRWAEEYAGLPALAEALSTGDAPTPPIGAPRLFVSGNPSVREEKEKIEAAVGIYSLSDPEGTTVARIVDGARLDAASVDPRLGDLGRLEPPAPIVLVLSGEDADTSYSLTRACSAK